MGGYFKVNAYKCFAWCGHASLIMDLKSIISWILLILGLGAELATSYERYTATN